MEALEMCARDLCNVLQESQKLQDENERLKKQLEIANKLIKNISEEQNNCLICNFERECSCCGFCQRESTRLYLEELDK